MPTSTDTIVVRLTPPGKAAIACLGLAGPHAWATIRATFRRARHGAIPEQIASPTVYFGTLGDSTSGADEVVLFVRAASPVPAVEIHCHGGPQATRMIEALFESHGVCVAHPNEWAQRLTPNHDAEILEIVTRCSTARTAGIALDQWHGAFDEAMTILESSAIQSDLAVVWQRRQRLQSLIPLGRHLVQPWRVILAGAPNVGKSSLVNALAGYTRCLVSPTPGTTRDVIATTIALEGWPVELTDTAGLREATEALEAQGITRARVAQNEADLVVWVLDATDPSLISDLSLLENALIVINKIDMPATWDFDLLPGSIPVSARTGEGIESLANAIVNRLVPNPPEAGEGMPITETQRRRLAEMFV